MSRGGNLFSHAGYMPGSTKTAHLPSGLRAHEFSLFEEGIGKVVLTKSIEEKKTDLGTYQVSIL